jgi:hypothetical protein
MTRPIEVPTMPQGPAVDANGNWTASMQLFFEQTRQFLQYAISSSGFQMPPVNNSDASIIEPQVQSGSVIFKEDEVNGGSSDTPNGQLAVRLADGSYHLIPNS